MYKDLSHFCVSVTDLRKKYNSDGVNVLDGLTFNIEYGKVFGFLGPNGAGKSTTIKILTTLLHPSSGNVRIFGKDIVKDALSIKKRIGLVLQQPSFEPRLTVERSLDFYGSYWGVSPKIRKLKVNEILETFELESVKHMVSEDLSIGQRRRLQVAREFIHDMDLLFLDEPTVGLDPIARRLLLDYIKKKVRNGLTVFFTTHIMEEAEYLCNQIAIINGGKIIAIDTPEALKQKYNNLKNVEITLKETVSNYLLDLLNYSIDDFQSINIINNDTVKIVSKDSQNTMVKIINLFSKNGIEIKNIQINIPTLEEVFLDVVKKSY
jgi:ABC-2 type transport system ATP-binding protein